MSLLISYTYHQCRGEHRCWMFWMERKKNLPFCLRNAISSSLTLEKGIKVLFLQWPSTKKRKNFLFFHHDDKKDFYSTQCEHWVLFAKENSFHLNPLKDYFGGPSTCSKRAHMEKSAFSLSDIKKWGTQPLQVQCFFFFITI